MNKLATFVDAAHMYVERIRKTIEEAYKDFQNLFEKNEIQRIDIGNYADEFYVKCDDGSGMRQVDVHVKFVEYEPGYGIYLVDDEENCWDYPLWCDSTILVFQTAVDCLNEKYEDYKKLKKGTIVRWIDPGIDDYEPEDREEQLNLEWVIDDCPEQDDLHDDSTISISNEYGESEVLAYELVYVRDGEE